MAVTTHGGATGDTTSMETTLPEAGWAIANQIDTATEKGQYKVDGRGLQEVVTDKGYHSNSSLQSMAEVGVRSYVPAPKQKRNWAGKPSEKALYVGNQRRVTGERGKQLLKRRGEFLERPFAHQYETGGLRRVHARGMKNVAKRVLLQAAAYNLALIMRSITKAGTPRGMAESQLARLRVIFAIYSILKGHNKCAQGSVTENGRMISLRCYRTRCCSRRAFSSKNSV